MSDTVLDIRNLKVQFLGEENITTAIKGIDLQLKRGEKLGIVGESGSGKSVTSLAIMGLIPNPGKITAGEIWFRPQPDAEPVNLLKVSGEEKRSYRGGKIAMIFQEPMSALNPVYNIGFQLTEAIQLHQDVSLSQAKREAIASLQEVKILPSDEELEASYMDTHGNSFSKQEVNHYINQQKQAILERYPHELSGGQLQRVCIAMALSCNPTLLIADEPTTALDVTVQATILSLLDELCTARGMSLIFITHDLGVIAEVTDNVTVMYKGRIVETGSIQQVFQRPKHPYTKGLIACRPRVDRKLEYLPTVADFMEVVLDANGEETIQEKTLIQPEKPIDSKGEDVFVLDSESPTLIDVLDEKFQGVSLEEDEKRLAQLSSLQPLLSVQDLQVGYPLKGAFGGTQRYFMAVKGISFEVYPGETLGLVGESGCGKSTLARTLIGLQPALQGQILFEGLDILRLKGRSLRKLRRRIQIVFQNPFNSLNPRLTIGKAIMEPMKIHRIGKNKRERKDRTAHLLERVGLNPDWMNRYPHEFSGGQRQRVCIARTLSLEPQFIICDESVSALDVSVQAQVLNLLKELQAEFGLTYIFISHDLSVVEFMSDRIMVMNKGRIEEIGPAQRIYHHPEKEYTRQLIASIPTGNSLLAS